jgi:16S rRNA (guanine966-N2)-methyltransferase
MRIIAGRHRSRLLASPPEDSTTRPLPDRVRESLFGLLRGHFEDAVVLDGFAGVGSFGLEALSRGARRVVMVEKDRKVARVLEANVASLKAGDDTEVVVGDALGPACLSRCPTPINIAFLDPPYAMVREPAGWDRVRAQMTRIAGLMAADGYLMVRTPWPFVFQDPRPVRGAREDAEFDPFEDDREPPPPAVHGDLRIDGTFGPETHEYKTTAIHLYMSDRGPGA